ncbi:hypothetical protein ACFY93_10030 [Streptomyces sp. NPDC008313]|uniref:hypothetical protein n=1 Tax=Streptomyces sp. NPDC008313 TaxID=3364826 RepID=UPI0036F10A01
MTVPEENRAKTDTTDDVVGKPSRSGAGEHDAAAGSSGRTMREAMEEAGVRPEDYEER